MAIRMNPGEFPAHRRQDPKRAAEARVFDALQNLPNNGHAIYEFRCREGGRQLDFALWLDRRGRFALQVKGGTYMLDSDGQWYLLKPDGSWVQVQSPLEETEEGCIEMHNAIDDATGYYGFVVGVLVFPDMERDEQIEWAARNHHHVHIIWGLNNLQEDLERIAQQVGIERPPRPYHSENECRRVFELQYRAPGGMPAGDPPAPNPARDQEQDFIMDGQPQLGSATFHIQHVGKLVVQHIHAGTDDDGRIDLPEG